VAGSIFGIPLRPKTGSLLGFGEAGGGATDYGPSLSVLPGRCSFGSDLVPGSNVSHRFESVLTQTGATQVAVSMTATSQGTCTTLRGLSFISTTDGSGVTVTSLIGGFFGNNTKDALDTVNRSAGLHVRQQTVGGTGNFGIVYSNATGLPSTAGTWGFFSDMSDPNYLGTGATLINTTTDDGVNKLQVSGGIRSLATTDSTTTLLGSIIADGGIACGKRLCLDGATGKTLRITNGVANASVAVTLGSTGPTGSTAGAPQGWMRVDINGTDRYIPFW
jgi:hypothetical protein